MYPFIPIGGEQISVYSLCTCAGASVMFLMLSKMLRKKLLLSKYIGITPFALLGVLTGAIGFGILSNCLAVLLNEGTIDWENCIKNAGIVYLGGLLGGLGAIRIACCIKERDFREIADILGIVIPLFHAFGRIGCFFAGCCYGKEYTGFLAIPYRVDISGEWIMRFPTQLLEAAFEFVVFLIHFIRYHKNPTAYNSLLNQYLVCYCIFRFVIEFWRGDEMRGVFCGVSFSQAVCVVILVVLFVHKLLLKRKEMMLV